MSGYGDMYREMQHARFMEQWAPTKDEMARFSEADLRETLRYNIARRRKAEAELKELRDGLNVVKKFLK